MQQHDGASVVDSDPFIIWTLRRTGGTGLATALFARSSCPRAGHEPFNADREFGYVTRACLAKASDAEIRAKLDDILKRKVLIKHCLETDVIPPRLNRLLVEASVAAGYRHVFLYRSNPLDRLLSLHFATCSGVWGKKLASTKAVDDAVFAKPLPVKSLLGHEMASRAELRAIYAMLASHGVRPAMLVFEDIYANGEVDSVRRQMQALLACLGLEGGPASDEKFFAEVVSGDGQGTRQHYSRFVNYPDLVSAVQELGTFEIRPPPALTVKRQSPLPDGLGFAEVWRPSYEADLERMVLSGVVLSNDASDVRVFVQDDEGVRRADDGLPSPKVARRFPGNPAATRSRFRVAGVRIPRDAPVRLLYSVGEGEPVGFAAVEVATPTSGDGSAA